MEKLHATAQFVKNLRIDVDDGRGHAICLDVSEDSGGTDMGPTPLELALMSYAGCYAMIFALTAKKMRVPLKDLEVKADAVESEENEMISEVDFDVAVAADALEDRIQRIHKLALQNCPVGKIFDKAGVKTTSRLRKLE